MLKLFDLFFVVVLLVWGMYIVCIGIFWVYGVDLWCIFSCSVEKCLLVFVVGIGVIVLV